MQDVTTPGDARRAGLLTSTVLATGVIATAAVPASAATTATFGNGVLTVSGDSADTSIGISRDAAGRILVNGGAIVVVGGTPTIANTSLIQVSSSGGTPRSRPRSPRRAGTRPTPAPSGAKNVLTSDGKKRTLPRADLARSRARLAAS
jgi:hypothetical protein